MTTTLTITPQTRLDVMIAAGRFVLPASDVVAAISNRYVQLNRNRLKFTKMKIAANDGHDTVWLPFTLEEPSKPMLATSTIIRTEYHQANLVDGSLMVRNGTSKGLVAVKDYERADGDRILTVTRGRTRHITRWEDVEEVTRVPSPTIFLTVEGNPYLDGVVVQ